MVGKEHGVEGGGVGGCADVDRNDGTPDVGALVADWELGGGGAGGEVSRGRGWGGVGVVPGLLR